MDLINFMEDLTRVFYIVDSLEDNEELYETREGAEKAFDLLKKEDKPRLYIAMVRNAFREAINGEWNYEDRSDTFRIVYNLID